MNNQLLILILISAFSNSGYSNEVLKTTKIDK